MSYLRVHIAADFDLFSLFPPIFAPEYNNVVPESALLHRKTYHPKAGNGNHCRPQAQDGTTAHFAQLLIKRGGAIVHREARTFDRKQAAAAWLDKREKELIKPGALDRLRLPDPTLAAVIDRYTIESIKKIGSYQGAGAARNQSIRHC